MAAETNHSPTQPAHLTGMGAPPPAREPGPVYPPSLLPVSAEQQTPPPRAPVGEARAKIFASEMADSPDTLGRAATLERLAQLLAHKDAQGPLSIGLIGESGSGKSHALNSIVQAARVLSAQSQSVGFGPFLPRLAILSVNADELVDSPEAGVAERLNAQLCRDFPDLARAANEAAATEAADPQALARSAAEVVDGARNNLATERAALHAAERERAQLSEKLLNGAAGGQFDAYARANRGRIESALAAFGFQGGAGSGNNSNASDLLGDYRGLVLTLTEIPSPVLRALACARALWAYRGQGKRLVWAGVFYCLAWGLGALARDRGWLNAIADQGGDSVRPMTNWVAEHISLFATGRSLALLAMTACLVSLLWRAWRFAQPLWRGAALHEADVEARRGEFERRIAHHAQRVEILSRDVESLAARAAELDKKTGGTRGAPRIAPSFAATERPREELARAYFRAIDQAIAKPGARAGTAPSRILFALDGLERLPPGQAVDVVSKIASALALPSFALVAAAPAELTGNADHVGVLRRIFQIVYRLPTHHGQDWRLFVKRMSAPIELDEPLKLDHQSLLDIPLSDGEHRLLCDVAGLAGPAPRNVARLVNSYRLARFEAPDDAPAVALMLAAYLGGRQADRDALLRAINSGAEGALATLDENADARLRQAFTAASLCQIIAGHITAGESAPAPFGASIGVEQNERASRLTVGSLRRGAAVARQWAL